MKTETESLKAELEQAKNQIAKMSFSKRLFEHEDTKEADKLRIELGSLKLELERADKKLKVTYDERDHWHSEHVRLELLAEFYRSKLAEIVATYYEKSELTAEPDCYDAEKMRDIARAALSEQGEKK